MDLWGYCSGFLSYDPWLAKRTRVMNQFIQWSVLGAKAQKFNLEMSTIFL